jgi:hypothetical protein
VADAGRTRLLLVGCACCAHSAGYFITGLLGGRISTAAVILGFAFLLLGISAMGLSLWLNVRDERAWAPSDYAEPDDERDSDGWSRWG